MNTGAFIRKDLCEKLAIAYASQVLSHKLSMGLELFNAKSEFISDFSDAYIGYRQVEAESLEKQDRYTLELYDLDTKE